MFFNILNIHLEMNYINISSIFHKQRHYAYSWTNIKILSKLHLATLILYFIGIV